MLQDGFYDLSYRAGDATDAVRGHGVAQLCDGRILGSDPWGGLFMGSYHYDAECGLSRVQVQLMAPPDGILITGEDVGPEGSILDLCATFKTQGARSTATLDMNGSSVAVELSYIGALPRPY